MSDNREERITFRVDPQTTAALARYLESTKRKKSDVVHEALHRFLLERDPEYRAEILGASSSGSVQTISAQPESVPLTSNDVPTPPFSPVDAPPASPGDNSLTGTY